MSSSSSKKTLNPLAGSFVPNQTSPLLSAAPVVDVAAAALAMPSFSSSSAPQLPLLPPPLASAPTTHAVRLPPPAETKATIHRLLLHARIACVQHLFAERPNDGHVPFERLLQTAFHFAVGGGQLSIATRGQQTPYPSETSGSGKKTPSSTAATSSSHHPLPFFHFFTKEQFTAVVRAIADAEKESLDGASFQSTSASSSSSSTSAATSFSDDELDILKGIYFRNVHSLFPAPLRRMLLQAMVTTEKEGEGIDVTSEDLSVAVNFVMDVFWFFYRLAFLPMMDECGLHALSACVQHLTQLKDHLQHQHSGHMSAVLRLVLPAMTLSRYYVVLMRGAGLHSGNHHHDGILHPQLLRVSFAQHFPAMMNAFLQSSPDDSLEMILEHVPAELLRDWLPLFFSTTSEVLPLFTVLLQEQPLTATTRWPVCTCTRAYATIIEAAVASKTDQRRSSSVKSSQSTSQQRTPQRDEYASSSGNNSSSRIRDASAPPAAATLTGNHAATTSSSLSLGTATDSAFRDQIMDSLSWCGEDDCIRFATLTLANTEVVPLWKLNQLLAGLRDAYCAAQGGSHQALFEAFSLRRPNGQQNNAAAGGTDSEVPRGLQEVIEVLMELIRPGYPPHVAALEEATRIVDKRVDDHVAACAGGNGQGVTWLVSPSIAPGVADLRGMAPFTLSPGRSALSSPSPQRAMSLDDTAAIVWNDPGDVGEMSVDEDPQSRIANTSIGLGGSATSVTAAFKASGSIW